MKNNNVFIYQYSAVQNKEIQHIRSKYLPKEENKIDTLRKMDYRVQTAGMVQSLSLGVIGCLIFGIGMCFGLDVFNGADWLAFLFCSIGLITMLPAYPMYKKISQKVKKKLTPEILRLSDEILKKSF